VASTQIDLMVLAEERRFLRRHCGLRDPEVAARLGISWAHYCRIFDRHPELGPLDTNPEQETTCPT